MRVPFAGWASVGVRARFAIWASVGVVASIALAIAVNIASGSSLSQWSDAASIASVAVAIIGILAASVSTFFSERSTNVKDEATRVQEELAFRLIRTFAAIEKEASLGYQQKSKAESPRPLSLRQVKVIMADSGIWDDQDQIAFDLATRARNAIVHGDLDKVDELDLRHANEKAEQLLEKVQDAGTAR